MDAQERSMLITRFRRRFFREPPNRQRVEPVFAFEYPGCQALFVAVWFNRYLSLGNQWSIIELFRDEVDTGAMQSVTGFDGTAVRIPAGGFSQELPWCGRCLLRTDSQP
jgi:hypothetical protein